MTSLSLDATAGASTANTYILVADVDTYALATFDSEVWGAVDETQLKYKYIVRAARLLDSLIQFRGRPTAPTQRLQWPRYAVAQPSFGWYDPTIIPQAVKDAQCELVIFLVKQAANGVTSDPFGASDSANLDSLTVGPISLDFRATTSADGVNFLDSIVLPILEAGNCSAPEGRLTR